MSLPIPFRVSMLITLHQHQPAGQANEDQWKKGLIDPLSSGGANRGRVRLSRVDLVECHAFGDRAQLKFA